MSQSARKTHGMSEQNSPPATIALSPHELERLIDRRIAEHEVERHRSHASDLEEETLSQIIRSLTPDEDLGYGKQYLLALLQDKSRFGLERFLDRALEAIDEEGKLDISRNFDADERRLFETMFLNGRTSNIKPESMTRRQFMRQLGNVAATGFLVECAVPIAADLAHIREDKPETQPWRRHLQRADHAVHYVVAPVALGAIGLHILNDMQVEDARIRAENIADKLSHIEWALDELVKASKKELVGSHAQRASARGDTELRAR